MRAERDGGLVFLGQRRQRQRRHRRAANALGPTLGSGAHTTTFQTSAGGFVTIIIGTPPNV
ncbi:MAG: hypothetical protein ABSH51_05510 [Solirubrobacteraceae bacterium]